MAGMIFYKRRSDGVLVPVSPGPQGLKGDKGDKGDAGEDFTPTDADTRYINADGDTMTGPLVVPAPTAASHAAQVTAIDPATGRLAIGGMEIGTTGRRDMTSLILPGALDPANTGTLVVSRTGQVVTWEFSRLLLAAGSGTLNLLSTGSIVPAGFRADAPTSASGGDVTRGNNLTVRQQVTCLTITLAWLWEQPLSGVSTNTRPDVGITGQLSYRVISPWPTTLPGTPA